jgi:VIT1/CCC1 family predicted Fe2+/Mn2+ transporter
LGDVSNPSTGTVRLGDASVLRAVVRTIIGGGLALALIFAIGHLVSTAVS